MRVNVDEVFSEAAAAFTADAASYWLHTLWTVQQESTARNPFSFQQAFYEVKKSGARELYRGFSVSAFFAVVGVFPYLKGAEYARHWFENDFGILMQGVVAQAAITPFYPATRLIELDQASIVDAASNKFKKLSILSKSKKIWEEKGARGLYRGVLPHFWIMALSDAWGFWFTEKISGHFSKDPRWFPQFFSTLLGFGVSYAMLTPLYAAETRLRIHETNPHAFSEKTFLAAAKSVYAQRGVRGFYYGAVTSFWYGTFAALPIACSKTFEHKNNIGSGYAR